MKVVKNKDGWSEITTNHIVVSRIALNFFELNGWLSFNEKNPKIGKRRGKCKCCRKPFEELGTYISLAVTNIGNEPICLGCANDLIANGIEHIEKIVPE